MLKRYIVFLWEANEEDRGGWDDVLMNGSEVLSWGTAEEAKQVAEAEAQKLTLPTWQVVDLHAAKVVEDYEHPDAHWS